MDVTRYRSGEAESERVADLVDWVPPGVFSAADFGGRDGNLTRSLMKMGITVTTVEVPAHPIATASTPQPTGTRTISELPDCSHDLAYCSEILEHIPEEHLSKVCRELSRVAKRFVLICVPYRQDLRVGRTICRTCGTRNPPWGHVSTFHEKRLRMLFRDLTPVGVSLVGKAGPRTNPISAILMDLAGNPYGTYDQDELCIHCGRSLLPPSHCNGLLRRGAARLAVWGNEIQRRLAPTHEKTLHMLFVKDPGGLQLA